MKPVGALKNQTIAIGIVGLSLILIQSCSPGNVVSNSAQSAVSNVGSSIGPSSPTPSADPSCAWVWADDFAPPTPFNLRPVLKNLSCSRANEGQKQNVIDSSADWTCMCSAVASTPTPTPTPTPTSSPTPSPPPSTTPVPLPSGTSCIESPNFTIDSSMQLDTIYSTSTISERSNDTPRLKGPNTIWTIRLVINSGDTSIGKSALPAISHVEAPSAQRSFRKVVISSQKCDMSSASNIIISSNSVSATEEFSVNEPGRRDTVGSPVANLATGVYYINVQNLSCPTNQYCDALLEWGWFWR